MKIQCNIFNTHGKSKVIVLAVLMLIVAHTYSTSAATLKLPPTNLGLIGYWPMDEGAGSVTKDISGNKNNGTLISSPTWTNGKLGKTVTLDGSTHRIDLPDNGAYDFTNQDFSLSAWINLAAYYSASTICKASPIIANDDWGWALKVSQSGIAGFSYYYNSSNNAGVNSISTVPLNKWTHVTAVFSKTTNTILIYFNGNFENQQSLSNTNIYYSGTDSPHIGAVTGCGGQDNLFQGAIDEVRIHNRALSAAEVQQLYSVGAAKMNTSTTNKNTSGLVGYWTFDGADTNTSTATDKSGSGNNGTLVSSPAMVTGKMGQALNLNGSSQYVNAGSSATLNLSSWSAVMWIKPSSVSGATYQALLGGRYSVGYATLYLKGSKFGVYTDADHFGTASLLAGKWSQVVATFSGGTYKTYVNGVLDINTSYSASFGPNGGSVVMGVNPIALNSERFTGVIDDTRVYSRALSATEIQQLYNTGVGTQVNSAQTNTPSSSLATGLVGYWPFNGTDISGTTAYDRSTGGNNGTLVGSPVVTLGKMGQALKFSAASTQKVDFATKFPAITSAVTISTWVNPDATQVIYADIWGNHQDDFKGMDLQQNNAITNQYGWGYGNGTSWSGLSGQFNISANTWTHIVAVKDSTTCYVYLNGAEQSGIRGVCSSAIVPATTMNFSVGRGYAGGGSRYFNGKIDDVRVYNRALSASEINQLYLLGK